MPITNSLIMHLPTYTINCDLGEGFSNEAQIIPLIDRASVACGGHFGDVNSIRATLRLVKKFDKKAGAHPSYPDLENFGRKTMSISPTDLIKSLKSQIGLFLEVAKSESIEVDHLKFHGALYNDAAENPGLADLLVNFLKSDFPEIPLFVPPHSEIERAALARKLPVLLEIFGDRAYQDNYKLVSRKTENSLFTQTNQVIPHLEPVFDLGKIRTFTGSMIPIQADTLCFHGDNPGIIEFLPQVRQRFWK